MNIVDDDTIDTVETYNTHYTDAKRRQSEYESSSISASVGGKTDHNPYNTNSDEKSVVAVVNEPDVIDEHEVYEEEEEVDEYNEEEFEDEIAEAKEDESESIQPVEVDAKQAQEGEIVRRLNKATNSNSNHNVLQTANNQVDSTDDLDLDLGREEVNDDSDPYVLECLIEEYRQKSLDLLGVEIFQQVYELCSQFMMEDFDPSNEIDVREHRLSSTILLNVRHICI